MKELATKKRIAIVDFARSPFAKSWTELNGVDPISLSTQVTRELLYKNNLRPETIEHIVWGTVIAVPHAPNIGREIALNLNMYKTPAFGVSRACASGLQSIANICELIWTGQIECGLAGGVDVTSNTPVPHKKEVIDSLKKLPRQDTFDKAKTLAALNPKDLLPEPPDLTERYTGKTMGQHAEEMAQYFHISREEQEAFSMRSHQQAHQATQSGRIKNHIVPIINRVIKTRVTEDNLIRPTMEAEKLQKMRPVFDRKNGTITAATSSALTDGASCVLLMSEEFAIQNGYKPLGFIRSFAFPALDPRENMLLGNVYACPIALERAGLSASEIDIWEIHEAFAAQVLSNIRCFDDKKFFEEKMGRSESMGDIDMDKINVYGGSLAYGHPFAATGGRLIMNAITALQERQQKFAIATACAAGGLGSAMIVEHHQ